MNGSPANSVGRGIKVGKEDLMGLLPPWSSSWTAVTRKITAAGADSELIVAGLEGIGGVRATVVDGDELFFPGDVRAFASRSSASARPTPTAPHSTTASPASSWLGPRHVRRPDNPAARRG